MRWLSLSAISFLLTIGLNWLLIPRFGLVGAALGTSLAVSGLYLTGLTQVRRSLRIWPYDHRYFKGMMATVVAALALFGLRSTGIGSIPQLNLLANLVIAGVTFGATLLFLGVDDEDQVLFQLVQTRLGVKRK